MGRKELKGIFGGIRIKGRKVKGRLGGKILSGLIGYYY